MDQKQINTDGVLPLNPKHICFKLGHNMQPVYGVLHNHQSCWGLNKCSRCGYEEDWQYDFLGSNPMYNQNT